PFIIYVVDDQEGIKRRIEDLRRQIEYHNYRYHTLDEPEISYAVFCLNKQKLPTRGEDYPQFQSPAPPTQRAAGTALATIELVVHPGPMLRLTAVFSEDELRALHKGVSN